MQNFYYLEGLTLTKFTWCVMCAPILMEEIRSLNTGQIAGRAIVYCKTEVHSTMAENSNQEFKSEYWLKFRV